MGKLIREIKELFGVYETGNEYYVDIDDIEITDRVNAANFCMKLWNKVCIIYSSVTIIIILSWMSFITIASNSYNGSLIYCHASHMYLCKI